MKPIVYGKNTVNDKVIEKVPAEEVNVQGLINTLEANIQMQIPADWSIRYDVISNFYKILFTEGELPAEVIVETNYEMLEMAYECIDSDLEDAMDVPKSSDGRNYYYEFARSFGVEKEASELKEFIDEECDFV